VASMGSLSRQEVTMIMLIGPEAYANFQPELTEMYRLRYRVFGERLTWAVTARGGRESDQFDAMSPVYLLRRSGDLAPIDGCVRLLPSTGATMLRDVFGELIEGAAVATTPAIWESSRFAIDVVGTAEAMRRGLAGATYELFAGMIEFGLSRELIGIVTVTDVRMERILRRANWPLRRLGEPRTIGDTLALAGCLEVSRDALLRVRQAGGIRGPVLWTPALITEPLATPGICTADHC
jgi:acyl homoserine lactone synthase